MFFVVSKLVELVLEPVAFLVLAGLAGLALCLTRYVRPGRAIATGAALLFAVACFSPLAGLLIRPLEDRFPRPAATMTGPTGIVVLGGALDEDVSAARGVPKIDAAAARLTSGAALALRYPSARLVFTGGSADVRGNGLDEASGVHALWTSLGVPERQMAFEARSRNTFENATLTRAMVQPKDGETWLLVTSAAHMPRSMGIFRRVGWPMTAYSVDYRTYGDSRDYRISANAIDSLQKLDSALHEWIGLAAYRWTGKTSALFPAP